MTLTSLSTQADLVGLKILAKAGYDPTAAIDVWQKMADLDTQFGKEEVRDTPKIESRAMIAAKRSIPSREDPEKYEDIEFGAREFFDSLVNSWFGSSHPPNIERIEYMRENMDEAILLYNDAIKLNGLPNEFIFSENLMQQQLEITHLNSRGMLGHIGQWLSSIYFWSGSTDSSLVTA